MKNYNQIANDIFERRDRCIAEKKAKRKTVTRITSSICFFVLVALFGIGVWQGRLFNTTLPPITNDGNSTIQGTDKTEPTKPNNDELVGNTQDVPVIWGDSSGEIEDMGYCTWNDKTVTSSLYEVLTDEKNKNSLIAIGVGFELDNEFVYNGKTLAEYEGEAIRKEHISNNLGILLKLGDELKYGEALYKIGTPDGTKWAKQLYDEVIESIDKDVLATYIVDGEFLKDKLESDMATYTDHITSRESCDEAIGAYYDFIAKETCKRLTEKGVNCEIRNGLILYMTADEFSVLMIDNTLFYSLEPKEADGMDMSETSGDDAVISQY